MVAAATMSLPERAQQGRNFDYRYCWIRDQCYAGQAVAAAGGYSLLDDAVRFVSERVLADGPDLKPAYCVTGDVVPGEVDLDLSGYPGAAVKTGNWVTDQFQLDAFGEALLLLASAARLDRLDSTHWRAAQTWFGPSKTGGASRMPASGKWTTGVGRTPDSFVRPVYDASAKRRRRQQGAQWQRLADLPAHRDRFGTACIHLVDGNDHRMIRGLTRRCCCPRSAGRCRPTIRAAWPR